MLVFWNYVLILILKIYAQSITNNWLELYVNFKGSES